MLYIVILSFCMAAGIAALFVAGKSIIDSEGD